MKKVDHIGSLMTVLAVSILLTSIFYRSVIYFAHFRQVKQTTILTKKTGNTSALYTQLLYEEKEGKHKTENFSGDNESKTKIFFISIIPEIQFTLEKLLYYTFSNNSDSLDNVYRTRLFLFNKSILI